MRRRCFNENALWPFERARKALQGQRWTVEEANYLARCPNPDHVLRYDETGGRFCDYPIWWYALQESEKRLRLLREVVGRRKATRS